MELRKIIYALLLSLTTILSYASSYSPDQLKNPNITDRHEYVADPASLVGQEAKARANEALWNLRKQTGVEAVIAVVPEIGDYSMEDYATQLFTQWGVGKSDKDNGVLVLIVPGESAARIATGYGVEGVIPDISARKIIDRSIVSYMRRKDLGGAVVAVASDIANVLSDPEAAAELKSKKGESWEEMPESDITADDILGIALGMAFIVFLIAFGKYIFDSTRLRKQDRYLQALGWHKERYWYILLSIFSLGLGLIPFLLVELKYRRARNKPMKCATCKGNMHKLNEEEDNKLLNASQDLEEKLNTVDYDVWVCDTCGSVEKYPFRTRQMKYEECPRCHTIAMSMVRDHTLVPSTTRHSGTGERIYECKYCHNRTKRTYTIPKKSDGTAAAIGAGAILGSGRSGGGFGGGFGGGHTGGGGATGRW